MIMADDPDADFTVEEIFQQASPVCDEPPPLESSLLHAVINKMSTDSNNDVQYLVNDIILRYIFRDK